MIGENAYLGENARFAKVGSEAWGTVTEESGTVLFDGVVTLTEGEGTITFAEPLKVGSKIQIDSSIGEFETIARSDEGVYVSAESDDWMIDVSESGSVRVSAREGTVPETITMTITQSDKDYPNIIFNGDVSLTQVTQHGSTFMEGTTPLPHPLEEGTEYAVLKDGVIAGAGIATSSLDFTDGGITYILSFVESTPDNWDIARVTTLDLSVNSVNFTIATS